MKARKPLALILSAAMILSMLSLSAFAAEGETAPALADAESSWAAESINRWAKAGIVQGDSDGNFNPAKPLSRAELATIFVKMFGLTEKADNTYADLKGDEWYADAILKCTAAGIMQGDGASSRATAEISRAETMVMFGRAMGVTPAEKPDMSKFTDADEVPAWAAGYMAPLAEMGILTGTGAGAAAPLANIDKASTMALLDKAIAVYASAPGEYSVDNANGFVVVSSAAAEGEVVLTGTVAGVVVAPGSSAGKVVAKDLTADTVKVDGAAAVSIEGKSDIGAVAVNAAASVEIAKTAKADTVAVNAAAEVTNNGAVKNLEVNAAAKVSNTGTVTNLTANAPAEVSNTGKVTTLTANDAVKVDNKGTISKAKVKADDVILDGKKPTTVDVAPGTKNPTNSDGKEIKDNTNSGSSGNVHYHSYTETTAATCTTNGLETCSCGDTRVIPALGHNFVDGKCENDETHTPGKDGNAMKFYLAVSGGGDDPTTVDAIVYNDYSAMVTVPHKEVNSSTLTLYAKMQNVGSLGVGEAREHTISISTGLSANPDLGSWLSNAFTFASGTITGTIDGSPYTYNLKGDKGAELATITATPEDIQQTREAWQALTANVTSTTHEDDSFVFIAKGSYLQIGTDRLEFESEYAGDGLKLDNFNDMDALQAAIREAVKLNTEADAASLNGAQIVGVLKANTQLAVSSSIVTLDKDVTISISGLTADYDNVLDDLRDSTTVYSIAQNLVSLVNKVIGDVDGNTVTINIDFGVAE